MDPETQRAEAERWLGIAAKLMATRDLIGSRTFAIRAREADPNNGVSEQILAVVDTVLAAEKRINASQQPDFYSILQLPKLVRDPELIADHYRRLLFCLNPERNSFPFADYALQLVVDAWTVLSDPTKKWLFDNELALFLQQQPQQQQQQPQHEPHHHQQQPPQSQPQQQQQQQLNTYQFFQPQPQQLSQLSQPQQQQQQQQMVWQQQPQQQQQIHQRDFMTQVTQQQVPPQWQMRDPTPIKSAGGGGGGGGGGGSGGGGGGVRGVTQVAPMMSLTQAAQTQTTPVRAVPLPVQTPVPAGRVTVAATTVVEGNAGNVPTATSTATTIINSNANVNVAATAAPAPAPAPAVNVNDSANNSISNDVNVNVDVNGNVIVEDEEDEEEEEEVVVEELEGFWTACPYCLYIFEYQMEYQGCALRCQNCRKVFHAVQIPNPPPICTNNNGGKDKGKEKEKEKEKGKENSFCCWGFFPLGFSMTAWKKHNQGGNLNGVSNWVPFSPMFANPGKGGGFQWFGNSDGNACGPIHGETKSTPRVYIDDDEAFLDLSESTDMDSSDGDWRTYSQEKSKKKKKKGSVGGRKRGRRAKPPKGNVVKQVNQNVASGGGVSVGGENMESGSDVQEVVFSLAAGDKSTTSKSVPVSHMRKQTRRSVKDVGRLDLNVEFNNDGEEHAPAVRAVNGEEDGIENIAFFEGLDEFLSTLPILNVGGDEKAKPS